MYSALLALHNLLRWIVILLAVLALVQAYRGWLGKRAWSETDRKTGLFFGMALDIQLLVGLILYFFLSPTTRAVLQNFGRAMSDPNLRFFGLEHFFYMLIAVILVHIGTARAKRAELPEIKHRNAAIFYTLAVIIILIAIPWWRPLLPRLS
jgi:uncharacterized membrane protein YozB (DUF420 family)